MSGELIGAVLLILAGGGVVGMILSIFRRMRGKPRA